MCVSVCVLCLAFIRHVRPIHGIPSHSSCSLSLMYEYTADPPFHFYWTSRLFPISDCYTWC